MSSRVDHVSDGASSGLHRDRSTDVVFSVEGMRYVGEVSFRRCVFVLASRPSRILPLASRVCSSPHRGLWALKSPVMI